MLIAADRRDFKEAFRKHHHTYLHYDEQVSLPSKRLLLVYCVECGLKYRIMELNHLFKVEEAQCDLQKDLCSHNFLKLLKILGCAGEYSFPQFKTIHHDTVDPNTFHQILRYSIRPEENSKVIFEQYNSQLESIAAWLNERV